MGDEIVLLVFLGVCFLSLVLAISVFLYFYLDNSCENDDDCDDDEICNFDSTTTSEEGECKKRTSIYGSGGSESSSGGNNRNRGIPCFYDLECTPTPAYCDGVDLSNLVEGECKSGAKPSNTVSQGFVQNEQENVASRARDEEWWTAGYMTRKRGGHSAGNYINYIRRYSCCNRPVENRNTFVHQVPEVDGNDCSGDLNGEPLGSKSCGFYLKFTPHEKWEDYESGVFN